VIVDIRPEPSAQERTVIQVALGRLLADGERAVPVWWQAGLQEGLELPDPVLGSGDGAVPLPAGPAREQRPVAVRGRLAFGQATALPRSRPGATRA
jgi:hypothetical protein